MVADDFNGDDDMDMTRIEQLDATQEVADRKMRQRAGWQRIAVECNECSKRFTVSATNTDPECPKCGSVDIDVRF